MAIPSSSYISQRAAEAIYTPEGKVQIQATIDYYMENARKMLDTLRSLGYEVYGGENAPYIWMRTPDGYQEGVGMAPTSSWKFFEELLYGANVVCTPGVGFGPSGGQRGMYPRCGLRTQRRGLCALHGIR